MLRIALPVCDRFGTMHAASIVGLRNRVQRVVWNGRTIRVIVFA